MNKNRRKQIKSNFFFLKIRLFLNGVSMVIERLYPAISYPVSRGTQMISPLILWDHSQDFPAGEYDEKASNASCERKMILNVDDEDSKYMTGHIIDGKCLYSFS